MLSPPALLISAGKASNLSFSWLYLLDGFVKFIACGKYVKRVVAPEVIEQQLPHVSELAG